MKTVLTFCVALLICTAVSGQTSVEITPQILTKIKLDIEKEVSFKKKRLEMDKVNNIQTEFTLDTFRVERLMEKYLELDFSDFGMREATYSSAKQYDSLLNKYYKKLLATLKGEDKATLIKAQKAWVAFRDSESKLVDTISKDEYSGGGTLQRLTEASEYLDLIQDRTTSIFNHYIRATQNF
jgi:uncharacterized protein YecT (DUF1311 family)